MRRTQRCRVAARGELNDKGLRFIEVGCPRVASDAVYAVELGHSMPCDLQVHSCARVVAVAGIEGGQTAHHLGAAGRICLCAAAVM